MNRDKIINKNIVDIMSGVTINENTYNSYTSSSDK